MPRYRPGPPPTREELLALPLHVLVRNWPELDPWLRERDAAPGGMGHLTLPEALGGDSPALQREADRMETVTRWRLLRDP